MKTCTKCGEAKLTDEFHKHSGRRDGLSSYCKACAIVAHAKYYAANIDKVKASGAKYYAENTDKVKACNAKWAAENPEKAKAIKTKWLNANRDLHNKQTAAWLAANPDKRKAVCAKYYEKNKENWLIYWQNRRARRVEAGGKLSTGLADHLYKLQRGKCACGCKQPLGTDYHLDHIIPIALGGTNTDDNIQLLRKLCNLQKSAKHPVDFMQQRGFLL